MDKKSKQKLLDVVKDIKLDAHAIQEGPDVLQRKWYKFGAYDALRILCETVMELPEPKERKKKTNAK